MKPITIFIFDEHHPVRCALADRLSQSPLINILGHTGETGEILTAVKEQKPDVVLLEVKRSDGMGLEILRQLAQLRERPKLFVLTTYPSDWEREAATRAGADIYLLKDIETSDLIDRIAAIGTI